MPYLLDVYVWANIIQLSFNLLLIPGSFLLLTALGASPLRALFFVFLVTMSPLYIFYAPLFEPNMLGLSFFSLGAAAMMRAGKNGFKFFDLCTGTFFLTLGTLAKPSYLFFGLPIAMYLLTRLIVERKLVPWISTSLSAITILIINHKVIAHAKQLYASSHIARSIHTPMGPAELPEGFFAVWENVHKALTTWFIEMNVNLGALPFLVLGVYVLFKNLLAKEITNLEKRFWLTWFVSLIIFCCLFVVRLKDHDYYITASLLLAAFLTSTGAYYWWNRQKLRPLLFFILLIIIPGLGISRAYKRWRPSQNQIPTLILEHPEQISNLIPRNDLVLIEGDSTPIVFLHYLKRKGLSLQHTPEASLTPETLANFRWLIVYNPSPRRSPITQTLNLQKVADIEDFSVYEISGTPD